MIRFLAALLALIALSAAARDGGAEEGIFYEFAPVVGGNGLEAVAVTMRFSGDADGVTVLELPDEWAGSGSLHEAVSALTVEGGTLEAGADPARPSIRHAPDAPLSVRYRLTSDAEGDPGPEYEKARPVIRPGWFYVHGEGAVAIPAGRADAPAAFAWGAAPSGWVLASDLDGVAGLTANDIGGAIFAGGSDFRLVEGNAGGQPVRLAIRGEWDFTDRDLLDAAARIIAAENAYLGAEAIPYFISLIPLTGAESGAMSHGGTGRTGGFALAATRNVPFDDFLRTLAHEYGHRWFGGDFGPVAEDDALDYWFTEGFGDFVAGRALVAAGLWGPAEYARMLNRVLLRYATSPARGLANAALAEAFWSDPAAMQAPYDRGHLFALLLDGGDGGLRAPLARMATRPGSFAPGETQAARFARASGVAPDRLEAMSRGEAIALPDDLFAPCGMLRQTEQAIYATGYTTETDAEGRYFASVEQGSPAWGAGLRPGTRYLERVSFEPGDASVPIVMRVGEGDGERTISWLPAGEDTVRFQRLELAEGAEDDPRCRARLGGHGGSE